MRPCLPTQRTRITGLRARHGDWRAAALQRAALVLAHAAPDAAVLTALQGPPQARGAHRTRPAHLFGLLDLDQGRAGIPDREEQLGVLVSAGGVVAPVHADHSSQ